MEAIKQQNKKLLQEVKASKDNKIEKIISMVQKSFDVLNNSQNTNNTSNTTNTNNKVNGDNTDITENGDIAFWTCYGTDVAPKYKERAIAKGRGDCVGWLSVAWWGLMTVCKLGLWEIDQNFWSNF